MRSEFESHNQPDDQGLLKAVLLAKKRIISLRKMSGLTIVRVRGLELIQNYEIR